MSGNLVEQAADRIIEQCRPILEAELEQLGKDFLHAVVEELKAVAGNGNGKPKRSPSRKRKPKPKKRKTSSGGNSQADKVVRILAKKQAVKRKKLEQMVGANHRTLQVAISGARKKVAPKGMSIIFDSESEEYRIERA